MQASQEKISLYYSCSWRKTINYLVIYVFGNLFTDKALVVSCTLENKNKISTHSLLDTSATRIAFIDKAMACNVCNALQILFIPLAKPKLLKKFDKRPARPITHAIYPTLTI